MLRKLLLTAIVLLSLAVRLYPAFSAIPLGPEAFYHLNILQSFEENLINPVTTQKHTEFPFFYWVLLFFKWTLQLEAIDTIRLIPPLLSGLGVISVYIFIKRAVNEDTAFITSYFYATTPLLIQNSYGPHSLLLLALPLLFNELLKSKQRRYFTALVTTIAFSSTFGFVLLFFVIYAFIFGYGVPKVKKMFFPFILGLIPAIIWMFYQGEILPFSVFSPQPIELIDFGFPLLFILIFMDYFEKDSKLSRFLLISCCVCLFSFFVGTNFIFEFALVSGLFLIFIEGIGANIFVSSNKAVIYRWTAFFALMLIILVQTYNYLSVLTPALSSEEYFAISQLPPPTENMKIFSDITAMQAMTALKKMPVYVTKHSFQDTDQSNYMVLLGSEDFGCDIIREANITHIFLSDRIKLTFPLSVKYDSIPSPEKLNFQQARLINIAAVCSIKND